MARVLVVGAGLYGAVCARELHDAGHRVLVVERRAAPGGNCATRYVEEADCHEHLHGAHIFHTDSERIWAYVNRFARFVRTESLIPVSSCLLFSAVMSVSNEDE